MADDSRRLLVATGNAKKLKEIEAIIRDVCGDACPDLVTTVAAGVASPEETGSTFAENALIKALHGFRATGLVTVADDSGLMVDALNGAPGVYSARYAGRDGDDAANNAKMVAALAKVPQAARGASFRSAVAVVFPAADAARVPGAVVSRKVPDVGFVIAEGRVDGVMVDAPRGEGGFGYDPYFLHVATGKTFAELAPAEKHALSHRGEALGQLRAVFAGLFGEKATS